jgi:hypothetical protein
LNNGFFLFSFFFFKYNGNQPQAKALKRKK